MKGDVTLSVHCIWCLASQSEYTRRKEPMNGFILDWKLMWVYTNCRIDLWYMIYRFCPFLVLNLKWLHLEICRTIFLLAVLISSFTYTSNLIFSHVSLRPSPVDINGCSLVLQFGPADLKTCFWRSKIKTKTWRGLRATLFLHPLPSTK